MLSSGANVIMVSSGANVIIWCYHVMLSSGMITHPFLFFLKTSLTLLVSGFYCFLFVSGVCRFLFVSGVLLPPCNWSLSLPLCVWSLQLPFCAFVCRFLFVSGVCRFLFVSEVCRFSSCLESTASVLCLESAASSFVSGLLLPPCVWSLRLPPCAFVRRFLLASGVCCLILVSWVFGFLLVSGVYLGWPIASSYMSPNAGGGGSCGVSANEYICTGAPINFGDLTPYFTYALYSFYRLYLFLHVQTYLVWDKLNLCKDEYIHSLCLPISKVSEAYVLTLPIATYVICICSTHHWLRNSTSICYLAPPPPR